MRGYDTAEYAASRLTETIIRYKDFPVMVHRVFDWNGEIYIRCTPLTKEEDGVLEVPIKDCDLNPVPLGYVNHGKSAHYIMRAPMRRDWRQGLRMLNIVDANDRSPRLVPYHVIAQTIIGSFPSFRSALDKINTKKIHSIAYDRNFAIDVEGSLFYKGLFKVGTVDISNGNVLIHDSTSWVREAFEQSMEAA